MRIVLIFIICFCLGATGCEMLQRLTGGIDEAAYQEADVDHDGQISADELNAFVARVKAKTSDNLPFPLNIIGGIVVGGAGTVWSEWRNKKKTEAMHVMADAIDTTGKSSPLKTLIADQGNKTITKFIEKRKRSPR